MKEDIKASKIDAMWYQPSARAGTRVNETEGEGEGSDDPMEGEQLEDEMLKDEEEDNQERQSGQSTYGGRSIVFMEVLVGEIFRSLSFICLAEQDSLSGPVFLNDFFIT